MRREGGTTTTAQTAAASRHGLAAATGPASEQRLVERAQAGDRAAFGQLYQRHVDDVYAYVRLRVRDRALAEDLTHDVFVSVLRGLPGFRWQGSFAPWLMRCAHNRVANHWRSSGRRPAEESLPSEDDPDEPRPELASDETLIEDVDLRLGADAVERAMHHLTDLQQQVIALRFGAGLSLAETAEAMSRSPNAIKNLQHHALAALRRHLVPVPGEAHP